MNLGAQYYRPPFPESKYWEQDLASMKESGLNTVQLWVIWAWVENRSGQYRFEDYDQLVRIAEKNQLGVILSTIAEIHPYWIHREVPESEMIDHRGCKVVSSNRGECHFGLTPGGCFDHPAVWERMAGFLEVVGRQYKDIPNLRGWDAWNELRWNVNADGLVCFCPYTLKKFRDWLDQRHGGLDGLNRDWKRRYTAWDEVFPGKLPQRPYTELMAFQHFLTYRANQHAKARYEILKAIDPERPVTVHGGAPSFEYAGWPECHTLDRGNDWDFADSLDGVGCSSFPKWQGIDDASFGLRINAVRSAARGKRVWLSELQGGRSGQGFAIHPSVDCLSQQRWIWNGIACGADTILFWCWRDEVFGSESSGFGLSGNDGLAQERLEAMKRTGRILEEHQDLLSHYKPTCPEVGVLFSPQTYYLHWAQEGSAGRAHKALVGYARALVKNSIPWLMLEEEHLDALSDLRLLFLPRTLVLGRETEERLHEFVRNGGTLFCESECGAFDVNGLYRYPEDRFPATWAHVREVGRRPLLEEEITIFWNDETYLLPVTQWLTPARGELQTTWASHPAGALLSEVPVGKGRLILSASYLGEGYMDRWSEGFENMVFRICRESDCHPLVQIHSPKPTEDSFVYAVTGESKGHPLCFVFFPKDAEEVVLRFHASYGLERACKDLISDVDVPLKPTADGQDILLSCPEWRFRVLSFS